MITIKVTYPDSQSSPISGDDIAALRRLEGPIVERAVPLFCNTSNYRWELDPEVVGEPHFRLIRVSDRVEIVSRSIGFLKRCTTDEFEDILVSRSFERPISPT